VHGRKKESLYAFVTKFSRRQRPNEHVKKANKRMGKGRKVRNAQRAQKEQ